MRENYLKLFQASKQLHKLNMTSILPLKMSYGDYAALHCIDRLGEKKHQIRIQELTRAMNCSSASLSRKLRELEEKGYIVRTIDTKDRRNTYVALTEAGQQEATEIGSIMDEYVDAVFDRLDQKDIDLMTKFMNELYHVMQEELDKRKK